MYTVSRNIHSFYSSQFTTIYFYRLVKPTITVENKIADARKGDSIKLLCEIDGDEPIRMKWRIKNGSYINSSGFKQIGSSNSDIFHANDYGNVTEKDRYTIKDYYNMNNKLVSELYIKNTKMSDTGDYWCIANNDYGNDIGVLSLKVQGNVLSNSNRN